jgi:hypothetical protein
MIGGTDTTFEVHALRSSPAAILHGCLLHWPESLYQKADEKDAHPVGDVLLHAYDRQIGPDFFIYKDRQSYEIWAREGASPTNEDTLLQFIITDTATPQSPYFQVTMVSDKRSAEIRAMELTIKAFTKSPYNMIGAVKHPRAGGPMTADDFEHAVLETCVLFFPKMGPIDILFNPRLGVQLCDMVRWRLERPIPDNMIMQALFIKSQGAGHGK